MFITKNNPVFLTLFLLAVTVFVFVPVASATSYASGGVSRRDHSTLKRFVKKRAVPSGTPSPDSNLAGQGIPLIGAAPDPSDTASANATSLLTTSLISTTTTDTATASLSTNTSTTATDSASTTTGNATTTTTTSSSSSSSTSSTTSQTSQTSATTPPAIETPVTPSSTQVTLTRTQTAPAQQDATNSVTPSENGGLGSGGKTALITVLIVVGASVGGFVILWTVFRKWKLGRSQKFDQRLQPISWEPTVDDDIVPHRSGSDAASFRSTPDNRSGYGATSNLNHGLDHDFTAGPAHLAPVGGYADLTRGPSPQPSMQEALSRGPSLTRPNYDASVPLHHQNNYGVQDTYNRY